MCSGSCMKKRKSLGNSDLLNGNNYTFFLITVREQFFLAFFMFPISGVHNLLKNM